MEHAKLNECLKAWLELAEAKYNDAHKALTDLGLSDDDIEYCASNSSIAIPHVNKIKTWLQRAKGQTEDNATELTDNMCVAQHELTGITWAIDNLEDEEDEENISWVLEVLDGEYSISAENLLEILTKSST